VTAPAVGDGAYLIRQIEHLMAMPPNLTVLSTSKPYRFGHPDTALLQKYRALKRSGIEFDLIYAPVMWTALMENIAALKGPVLYVHSGGVSGNTSMLARYARMESLRCDGAQAP
jgi:1-aminocyclopropane-1-carboxylate deaminase